MAAVFDDLSDQNLIALLHRGGVGVMPTDTVYGLVCIAAQPAAVERLYRIKKREKKPGTIIAESIEQLTELGLKKRYLTAVEQYWPGAVSVVIPSGDPKTEYLRQGVSGLAVRIVADKKLCKLLKQTGALVTSSANHPGERQANTIEQAMMYFKNDVDFYVDGGDRAKKKPSTLIRVIDDAVEVLREGAVTIKQ